MPALIDPPRALSKEMDGSADEYHDSSADDQHEGNLHDEEGGDHSLPPADIYRPGSSTDSRHYDVTVKLLRPEEVGQFRAGPDQRKLLLTAFVADINVDSPRGAMLDMERMFVEDAFSNIRDHLIDRSQCYLVRWFGAPQIAGMEIDGNNVGHAVRGTTHDEQQVPNGGYQRWCSSEDEGSDGWNVAFMFFMRPADEVAVPSTENVPLPGRETPPETFVPDQAIRLYFGNEMRRSAPYQPWHIEGLPADARVFINNEYTRDAFYHPMTSDGMEYVTVDCRLGHATRNNSFTVERRGGDLVITASNDSSTDVFLEIKYHDNDIYLIFTPRPSI